MSIVLTYNTRDFAAIACDGRLSVRNADGSLRAIGEHNQKCWQLTDEIAFGMTGSGTSSAALLRRLRALVEANKDSLFAFLAAQMPGLMREELERASATQQIEGLACMLLGYDVEAQAIRSLG